MELYRPTIERLNELKYYLQHNQFYGCQLALSNVVLWSEHYNTYYTTIADMLVFCQVEDGKPCAFTFPIGAGDAKAAFDAIVCYFKEEGLPVVFYLIDHRMYEQIESWYPDEYSLELHREDADYLYTPESLATLKGKKLHAKRNHIHRFIENYPDYQYEEITDDNAKECLELARNWMRNKASIAEQTGEDEYRDASDAGDAGDEYRDEYNAIELALRNREKLSAKGGVLRVNGKVVAFTIGSPINEKVFDVHFEKAYAQVQGAYAMINREFVRKHLMNYEYINREEDLGIEGLRSAKLSYHPAQLLEKGTLTAKK